MESIRGSFPSPICLNSDYLSALAELAEVLGHGVGVASGNAVAGAAAHLASFGFARLTPQLHFERLKLGENLAADARVKFGGGGLTHLQTREFTAQILNLASQVGVVPELFA